MCDPMTHGTGRSRIPRGKARRCGVTEDSGCRWGIKTLLKVSRGLSYWSPGGKVTWGNSIPLADHGRPRSVHGRLNFACIPVCSRGKMEGHRLRVKEWPGKDKIPPPGVGPRGWAGLARVGRGSCFAREAYPGLNRKVMWRRKPGPSKSFLVYDR